VQKPATDSRRHTAFRAHPLYGALLLVLLVTLLSACAPEEEDFLIISLWTRLLGSAEVEDARAVAVDASGYVYICGSTLGALGTNPAPSSEAAFLAKYDPDGALLWVRVLSSDRETARSITLDDTGNIYITGGTYGTLFEETNAGGQDAFVAKYDNDGILVWGKLFGTTGGSWGEIGQGIVVDNAGNVYISGMTDGGLGEGRIGHQDAFIMKLNSAGAQQWVRTHGVAGTFSYAYDLIFHDNALYTTGSLSGNYEDEMHQGGGDLVLIKSAALTGMTQWVRMIGSNRYDTGTSLAVDASGNIYVAGRSQGHFDGNTNTSTAGVQARIALVKYNAAGTKQWSRLAPGQFVDRPDNANGLVAAPDGNIYVTGLYANEGTNMKDLVVLQYSPAGALLKTELFDSGENEEGYGIAADANSTLYIAGGTGGNLDNEVNAGAPGVYDAFIKKMRMQ
jgi:hypothetical protein